MTDRLLKLLDKAIEFDRVVFDRTSNPGQFTAALMAGLHYQFEQRAARLYGPASMASKFLDGMQAFEVALVPEDVWARLENHYHQVLRCSTEVGKVRLVIATDQDETMAFLGCY